MTETDNDIHATDHPEGTRRFPFFNNWFQQMWGRQNVGEGVQNPRDFMSQFLNPNQREDAMNDEEQQQPPSIAQFARSGTGSGRNFFTSIFGRNVEPSSSFQSTSVHVDPDGKVTTVESGSDIPDKVTVTRIAGQPGQVKGIFAAAGSSMDSDGRVNSFRHIQPYEPF